jgi:hypothetical protein
MKPRSTSKTSRPSQGDSSDSTFSQGTDIASVVRSLVTDYAEPARILELYYWSQEPGLPELIRALMALPPAQRAALQSFFAMISDPNFVSATIDPAGGLTLFSPDVAEALAATRNARQKVRHLASSRRSQPG